jgi:ubiquinone/menaquinone biosynthesis C-methylase UbiE
LYPVDAELDVIDFLPDARSGGLLDEQSRCWDEDAERDEVFAAVSQSKRDAGSIFVKMPPGLAAADVDGKVCLDLGCGYGRTLLYTALNGRPDRTIGIDVSRVMLSKARGYARERGLDPALARAGIDALPLRSESVDFVYSSSVFIHCPEEVTAAALRETLRVLRPTGVALFENSFLGWLNPEGIQTKLITTFGSRWLRPAWVRTYRRKELECLLRQTGPLRSIDVRPERYTILPRGVFKLQFGPFKPAIKRANARASKRVHGGDLFVGGWSVRLVK